MKIQQFIHNFPEQYPQHADALPWDLTNGLMDILLQSISLLQDGGSYLLEDNIAIHKTAIVENNVVLKGPLIIGPHCFLASGAYLRGGVHLVSNVTIGPGCEVKSSIIFSNNTIAHFNFIGNSIIGNNVNFEAGAVVANRYNERVNKEISVLMDAAIVFTGTDKFGALVGDDSKIGANAVLSPGTILTPGSVVRRLELVEQVK